MAQLDREFRFTEARNAEILAEWLLMSARERYAPAYPRLEEFLSTVGRRKFVRPLYGALMETDQGRDLARRIYARARPSYHPITQRTIDGIVR